MNDWQWWDGDRYCIRPTFESWVIWDKAAEQQVGEPYSSKHVMQAYREAMRLNEMEKQHGKQPA